MADNPMRVIVVGCGDMSQRWIGYCIEAATIELVGLVDLDRHAALKRAEQFSLPPGIVFDSLTDALAKARPDAVFDVTIPAAHDKVTIEVLEAGCHVLGEKPMSDSLDKAQRMAAAAKKADRLYAVTQTRRASAGALSTAAAIRGGVIGSVQEVHCDFYVGARFGGFRARMDDPLILDMAIHTFDQARQLTGADPVSVYCHSWNPPRSWYAGDASAAAIFEMELPAGGSLVYSYRGSWATEGVRTDWHADWRIVGQNGTLHWNGADVIEAEVVEDDADPGFMRKIKAVDVPRVEQPLDGHRYLIEQFAGCVRAGTGFARGAQPDCPCQDNLKSVAMTLAAAASAKAGRKLDVVW